jgi:uncharacterized protein
MKSLARLSWTVLALAATASVLCALEVPYLSGRVNDLAGVLSASSKQRLEEELRKLEEDTGAQVAILTIPTLDGESLEEYSLRVAETWKLGRGKFDDGALVLIARDDRQMRIEVGYGLEAALTDAKSRRILDDLMRPRFREGDFDGGVETAVKAIDGLVRGDENALPAPEPKSGVEGVAPRAVMFLVFAVVIGIFSLVALATEGAGAWFFYLFLTPFWLAFPIAIFGSRFGATFGLAWLLGFPILHRILRKKRKSGKLFKSTKWSTGGVPGGGWVWSSRGGGFGGSRGGWGGGGGGFSGGGGSFGGGGASGRW